MTKLWAIPLGVVWLGVALAGCAGSPTAERDDAGEVEPEPPPDVVVIGSKQDAAASAPVRDAASAPVDAGRPLALVDSGERPKDAGVTDGGSLPPEGEPKPVADAGQTSSDRDARMPAEPYDAGAQDAGVTLPVDAGTAMPVDAGAPPVADAGRVGCFPGTYKGSFEGEISALLGVIRIDVAGDITIEVELGAQDGDRLMIRHGVLQGTDTSEDKNPLFARIGGVLNCATKKLENGTITDGTYNRVDPLRPFEGPTTTTFSGTISGVYATNPPAAVGTWMVKSQNGARTSMGTFNAALQ
jgi:hypothetical protein